MQDHPVALVTGAARGIGAAFARRLALANYGVILVDVLAAQLEQTTRELAAVATVPPEGLQADLATEAGIARVCARIRGLPALAVLVNNAGVSEAKPFLDLDAEAIATVLGVNNLAAARLTQAALPGMQRAQRGTIINLSSVTAFVTCEPVVGPIYGSSKSFLLYFSKALATAYRGSNIVVQACCPGLTRTTINDELQQRKVPTVLWETPDNIARVSLRHAARRKGVSLTPRTWLLLLFIHTGLFRMRIALMQRWARHGHT